ncbi:MAG: cation:proton antiporter [Candidatus Promineifilaceae bacterium]
MATLPTLLMQIGVILAASQLLGALFGRIRQPQVIGEMVAGIMLGPSFLGWLAPSLFERLFPPGSLALLAPLSQIGLLLFMFLIGLELNWQTLRGRGRRTVVISQAGIFAPLALSLPLAWYLHPRLGQPGVPFLHFALFVGTAMSITAFPVLARILADRGLVRTPLGALALAAAAIGDVSGWSLLALVVFLVRAAEATLPVWLTLVGSLAFVLLMAFAIRPALRLFAVGYEHFGRVDRRMMALILLLILAAGWITERLGIHALFGAFLLGAMMPRHNALVDTIALKLEDLTVVLLLPIFFALIGLQTRLGLVAGWELWLLTGLIIAVAILGKLGGVSLAARANGLPWRQAAGLGLLMNTRGLMELVVLTIGLEIGVLSPTLFTMLVLMALLTTFMTSPLLHLLGRPAELPNDAVDYSPAPSPGR